MTGDGPSAGTTHYDKIACQHCDAKHDTPEEHTEHVERMHYATVLREAEGNE